MDPYDDKNLVRVEQHTFQPRFRVGPSVVTHHAPRLVAVEEPDRFFATQGLTYFKVQNFARLPPRVMTQLSKSRQMLVPTEFKSWDRATIEKGRNRKCRLVLVDGFDPAVFASESISAGEIVGVMASDLVVESQLPPNLDDTREAIWIHNLEAPSLYRGEPLRFSSLRGGNVFRFMRHCVCAYHERQPNVALHVVWLDGLPYLVVRALADVVAGSELLYDWGKNFCTWLGLYDLANVALSSQALHQRLCDLTDAVLEVSEELPPWLERPQQRFEITFGPTGVAFFPAGSTAPLLELPCQSAEHQEQKHTFAKAAVKAPLSRRSSWTSSDDVPAMLAADPFVGLEVVSTRAACESTGVEFLISQPESQGCRAVLAHTRTSPRRPQLWQDAIKPKFHERADTLIKSDTVTGVSVRRIDSLHHHVRWSNSPASVQFGVWADEDLPALYPVVTYKGLLTTEQEAEPTASYFVECPDGINILVDASVHGNEGRFVNDPRGTGAKPNCRYVWTWDAKLRQTMLFVVSKRKILRGEEITASYGDEFWTQATPQALRDHAKFMCMGVTRVLQLERCLTELGRSSVPPVRVFVEPTAATGKRAGRQRVAPYRCSLYPSNVLATMVEQDPYPFEVETIVAARRKRPGHVEYLVRFVGVDPSWNQWLEQSECDPAAVEAYHQHEGGVPGALQRVGGLRPPRKVVPRRRKKGRSIRWTKKPKKPRLGGVAAQPMSKKARVDESVAVLTSE